MFVETFNSVFGVPITALETTEKELAYQVIMKNGKGNKNIAVFKFLTDAEAFIEVKNDLQDAYWIKVISFVWPKP